MPEAKNYLLGYGERLTAAIDPPQRRPAKTDVYTFGEAQARLAPRIRGMATEVMGLPAAACPHNESVAAVTIHPSYLAKSYFPRGLFETIGLKAVGSRPLQILPEKGAKKAPKSRTPTPSPAAEIFVMGRRRNFQEWARSVSEWTENFEGAGELVRIEDVHFIKPAERVKPMRSKKHSPLLEVVLHRSDDYVLEGFRDYLRELGIGLDLDQRISVRDLCFLSVRVPLEFHERMAQFSFLRVAREMPELRQLRPVPWSEVLRSSSPFRVKMEDMAPLNPELRVAVFDGGVPKDCMPRRLVRRKRTPGSIGQAVPECQGHGLGVTSALLYGSLVHGKPLPQPFCSVDHYRVIDVDTAHDPQGQYFGVLNRIMNVLRQNNYQFVNLSLGPDLPIEDGDVHVWTASLDEHFSDGRTLVTVAAGNTGEHDWDVGNARIQAPADGVNVLSVGAADCEEGDWRRAPYSSIGPGRSPGLIKPDVLAFGGSKKHPFWIPCMGHVDYAIPIQGTSFAAPLALRAAIAIRTHLGPVVEPLALKALLIHHSEPLAYEQREVGWGRVPTDFEEMITCPDGTVHILYQGSLEPGKYLRARVTLPASGVTGDIRLKATFCYATETDPQDPINYTRAGLEITFRPDKTRFNKSKDNIVSREPASKPFFSVGSYESEEELRRDAHKWEPCLKAAKVFRATTLNDPVFDIHYNARRGGANDLRAQSIPYTLVLTIHAKQTKDLYNKVTQRYRTILQPLQPVLQIPVRTAE
jgi:hypothetical protein